MQLSRVACLALCAAAPACADKREIWDMELTYQLGVNEACADQSGYTLDMINGGDSYRPDTGWTPSSRSITIDDRGADHFHVQVTEHDELWSFEIERYDNGGAFPQLRGTGDVMQQLADTGDIYCTASFDLSGFVNFLD